MLRLTEEMHKWIPYQCIQIVIESSIAQKKVSISLKNIFKIQTKNLINKRINFSQFYIFQSINEFIGMNML